jgi:hypothetical protein
MCQYQQVSPDFLRMVEGNTRHLGTKSITLDKTYHDYFLS